MRKYKTVKEVCALTGLTGKHLYYFHHEKVVCASAYANYSVAGNDGYKLYDDAAVEKLRQIALYYRLGLKRNEIRDIMLDPAYNSKQVLEHLLTKEKINLRYAQRNIAVLEYLLIVGLKHSSTELLWQMSVEELEEKILALRRADTLEREKEEVK